MPVSPNTRTLGPLTETPTPNEDIITLVEYQELTSDTNNDAQATVLIPAASRAVRNYAGRSFALSNGVTTDRSFLYDGSGILDIDDCASVTAVATDAGVPGQTYPLDATGFTAMPFEGEVFYWLVLYGFPSSPSPAMGFTHNLDTMDWPAQPPVVTVTADWGWPSIPPDVKLATAWTVEEVVNSPEGGPVSESIESFSRSWSSPGGTGVPILAIPNRARDLLAAYQNPI
jgi:hypothetical protein